MESKGFVDGCVPSEEGLWIPTEVAGAGLGLCYDHLRVFRLGLERRAAGSQSQVPLTLQCHRSDRKWAE